jgi:alpha-ketoglutarate-dependent taurine dioxygenase
MSKCPYVLDRASRVVHATTGGTRLHDLPAEPMIEAFREAGALIFRGFGTEPGEFAAFTGRFSTATLGRVHAGQNRRKVAADEATSTVDLGKQHVGPHAEMGYSPIRPDLLWFYCARPPADGGETTLFDGEDVWLKLPERLREKCASHDLIYSFDESGPELWPLFTGVAADRDETLELLAALPGVSYVARDNGKIDIAYQVPAAPLSRYHGVPAFANSIIPSESSGVTFADGTPVRSADRLSILDTCEELVTLVEWQRGDVVMVDNSRMMHGRRPFSDPGREIHVRMTNAAF